MNDRTAALTAFAHMMATETEENDYLTMDPSILEELAYRFFPTRSFEPGFWDYVLEQCSDYVPTTDDFDWSNR